MINNKCPHITTVSFMAVKSMFFEKLSSFNCSSIEKNLSITAVKHGTSTMEVASAVSSKIVYFHNETLSHDIMHTHRVAE